ncbi:MAG: tRNA (N(6)-L-threonylcarbamoyladenosine(37)-C(2))-methylthiotransferase MtaB [Methylobacterium sp.]|uniref:tRNA (N(6)-L-threonylcarbamoyladenosine(37)-C(2))- methylthiotransferase MtaB n=1 Tax=Methylobacterium sp. TaxID=409 RepID=UPI0025D2E2B1|nr:tRNA (N(6)-L-threonylcarbamoyladenosine(37)-C(2))-methylthiotransferase MtaB [Methylobacterium sp.]MBX9930577.1 tRNA (N(6)-L-threonylcarbamoyladenosine(37)-C(2))-methylthiotransferase MtaB [Methylobacterium sp.]
MAVETLTFGCRLNIVESEIIRLHAEAEGRDRVVVNTCAVTAEAGRQARKAIRRLARERPGAEIVVTGCGAQVETEAYAAMPEVARLVGNDAKLRPETWREKQIGPAERVAIDDIMSARRPAATSLAHLPGHTRAFVPVQNGCDHRCTFCVIPFGRGNSRSVPLNAVVEQVARLVDHGGREVVLTGVDLTAYGRDLDGTPTLGRLVRAILARVPDLARLRLSSIDSVEVDPELMEALATDKRLMPHLHLSLQAGDDLVLKRMKRRHLRDDAIRFCEEVRRMRTGIVFGADLIAGFPTETDEQFSRSLDLVRECGLTHLHVFPYSPRPETPAARMPPVAAEIVRERAARLREAGAAALTRHLDAEVGLTRRVLTERGGTGRTEEFTVVRLAGEPGEITDVVIAGHDGRVLIAA